MNKFRLKDSFIILEPALSLMLCSPEFFPCFVFSRTLALSGSGKTTFSLLHRLMLLPQIPLNITTSITCYYKYYMLLQVLHVFLKHKIAQVTIQNTELANVKLFTPAKPNVSIALET